MKAMVICDSVRKTDGFIRDAEDEPADPGLQRNIK